MRNFCNELRVPFYLQKSRVSNHVYLQRSTVIITVKVNKIWQTLLNGIEYGFTEDVILYDHSGLIMKVIFHTDIYGLKENFKGTFCVS